MENRTWNTGYRGRILIHASKTPESFGDFLAPRPRRYDFCDCVKLRAEADKFNGCLIGSVEIVDCVQDALSSWAERGMWHWILKDPVPFAEPIPAKGMLGLWNYAGIIEA